MSDPISTSKVLFEKGKAGYAAIYLQSPEDQRSMREVKAAATELKRDLFYWTMGKGLIQDGKANAKYCEGTELPPPVLDYIKKQLDNEKDPRTRNQVKVPQGSIIVLRLFHHFLDDPLIQAGILDLIPDFKLTQRMLVIQAPVIKLPPELEKEFALVEMSLPGAAELQEVLQGIITGSGLKGDKIPKEERVAELIEAAKGLTTTEAENALSLSLLRPLKAKTELWDPKIVLDEKCLALRKTGLLEYIPVDPNGLSVVGGLDYLKEWVRLRRNAFTIQARQYGLPEPKGMLCVGPPGTGKSLVAKAISGELHKPLLKLDMGKVFAGLVGSSEANIRLAIAIAEAVAPCILWIDEIEKGIAGANSGLDSGVGARVLGTLLTWMQEKRTPVFVFATSNDVTGLPPELLRKGRFDEMFNVDLPSARERKEILSIHLRKKRAEEDQGVAKRAALIDAVEEFNGAQLSLDTLAGETTEGFTGAEIEGAVIEAMMSAFDAGRDVKLSDILQAFDNSQPISKTMQERLGRLREWCKVRTRPANRTEPITSKAVPAPVAVPIGTAGRAVDMKN